MKTDIEKQFIKEYQFGGIVHYCIETIRYSYNLEYIPPKNDNHNEFKKKYYNEILPSRIKQKMRSFDESIITSDDSALLNEISDNLEYKTKQEKERYILTLIVPFKELSDLLNPELAVKKRIDNELFENEKDRKYWSDIKDFNNIIINDKTLTTEQAKKFVKDNLQAIDNFAIEKKEQYNRVKMISERFKEKIKKPKDEVEKTLSKFNKFKFMFANRLDALCLIHNIDFLALQHVAGTYLILKRDIGNLSFYIGSLELTNYYIDKLPKKEEKQPPQLTKDLKPDVQKNPPPQLKKELTQEQIENLKEYFKPKFRGIKSEYNCFDKLFIPELTTYINSKSSKEFARIAYIIFKCSNFNKNKNEIRYFKDWLIIFYEIMGITYVYYRPKDIINNNDKMYIKLKEKFDYLNMNY